MSGLTINPGTQSSWGMQCWIWLSNKFERGTKINRLDENPKNSIIIYTTEDGLTKIDATFDGDTVWLSIDQIAELFQRGTQFRIWATGIPKEYMRKGFALDDER